MTVVSEFPHRVQVIDHVWIPLSDGVRLAARVWLPEDAGERPVPAILEYLPYRLSDGTAERDALQHPYFAGHGYASVRVDMRGSGNSEGILLDEYLKQEQDDALEVLEWLAAQPWCSGEVGIIGISWGGFNGLQIAARRPPQLKAIITLCSTDDRYADDVHYNGGCLNSEDQLTWASYMYARNARPPLPCVVGERWREMWFERMEQTPPWIDAWMRHQRRDAYWKHGSVGEAYGDIECAVYAVGGWADGYTNAVMRMLEGLACPRKGLIGPWAHAYPEFATPGPQIGFLQECLRWWDHWLKGEDSGIMDEPALRLWLLDSIPPSTHYVEWPGRWIAEPSWPSPHVETRSFHFGNSWLLDDGGEDQALHIRGSLLHGRDAGTWCPYGVPGDFPTDQRAEDGLALTLDTPPQSESVDIVGYPEVTLDIASDRPLAMVAIRLCDVWPDGTSALITRGLLNLTHRESHEHPELLEPGRRYTVTVRLNAIAWSLPAGHRLRLAVSPDYWPWAWPCPEPVTLTVNTGGSQLALPVREPRPEDDELPEFGPPETAPALETRQIAGANRRMIRSFDPVSGRVEARSEQYGEKLLVEAGIEAGGGSTAIWSVVEGDPLSASIRVDETALLARGGWRIRIETSSTLTADASHFHLTNLLEAFEGDVRVHTASFSGAIPRDFI